MAGTRSSASSAAAFSSTQWDVDNPLVRVDRSGDPLRSIQVQHLDYPYEVTLSTAPADISGYRELAYNYLKRVNAKLGVDELLLNDLDPNATHGGWIELVWLTSDGAPGHSYWLHRYDFSQQPHGSGTSTIVDSTLVLLAGLTFLQKRDQLGGQGIRILAQVRTSTTGSVLVRIMGVTSTTPSFTTNPATLALARTFTQTLYTRLLALARKGLPPAATLAEIGVTLLPNFRTHAGTVHRFEMRATTALPATSGRESTQLDASSHRLTTRADYDQDGNETMSVAKQPLIAFADPQAQVLKQDPVSRYGTSSYWDYRPSRPSSTLDKARETTIWDTLPTSAGYVALTDGEVQVRHVRLVDAPKVEGTPKQIPEVSNAAVRSNEFTAVSAFYHGQSLFKRIREHGLARDDLLRFVSLPLDIHYRAGVLPGYGDGRTINAQVRWAISMPAAPATAPLRRLELRFALGDLSTTAGRLPANLPTATERHPLGVATDPRWCWHEFGHVLIAGTTGELELPFAHSVGDALAAIECDPQSALACDDQGAADNSGAWRHATYPWIHIPRRHDRDVQAGWSWTETVCGVDPPHGYRSEQLLSTTLFRLYRALGGDCQKTDLAGIEIPDRDEREKASRYVSYLVMRTLASLGPANVSPCATVDIFVHAMRSVDCATSGQAGPGGYVGGTTNKVIQWAFERQGLYGKPLPGSPIIGPEGRAGGQAQVDLHIEDRRETSDGPYTPVDLLGSSWHAAHAAVVVRRANPAAFDRQKIDVTVHNRGADAAASTSVQVWCAPLPNASSIPEFPGPEWVLAGNSTGSVPGNDGVTPGLLRFPTIVWRPTQAGRYAVLVSASCPLDRANIDSAIGYPCATEPGPVSRLVAFDNNLGLTIVST